METIRSRLVVALSVVPQESMIARAERIALHVRKIVEGVAYAALSATEIRNRQTLINQRSKDADKLLIWLKQKNLLKLPSAQRMGEPVEGYALVLEGGKGAAAGFDLDVVTLLRMFSNASKLIHERHPERLMREQVATELKSVEDDIKSLKDWLWLHIMFLRGTGFLIQMGQYGTDSFMVPLTKQSDLPPEFQSPASS